MDHTRTFALWQTTEPIRPLVEEINRRLPQKLAELRIELTAQETMKLAIGLAWKLAGERGQAVEGR